MDYIFKTGCLLVGLALVSGCVTIESIHPAGKTLLADEIQGMNIASIEVKTRSIETDPEIAGILKTRLEEVMPMCATGSTPYDMSV